MNATVKMYAHREQLHRAPIAVNIHKPGIGTLLLTLIVLLSGLAVIYVADINRRLAINLEDEMTVQNQLHTEWGKLLLEQSTWSSQARVQSLAAEKLGMQSPSNKQVVIVKI